MTLPEPLRRTKGVKHPWLVPMMFLAACAGGCLNGPTPAPPAAFTRVRGWWFAPPADINPRDNTLALAIDDDGNTRTVYCGRVTGAITFGRLTHARWDFTDTFGHFLTGSALNSLTLAIGPGTTAVGFSARRILRFKPAPLPHCAVKEGGQWRIMIIDASAPAASPVAVAFAPDGLLKAAYCTTGAGRAVVFAEYVAGMWSTHVVDAFGDVGPEVGITLSPESVLTYTVHQGDDKADIRTARMKDGDWVTEDVAKGVAAPKFVGVAASETETMVFTCAEDGLVVYTSRRAGNEWRRTVLVRAEDAPESVALAVTHAGQPFLAYVSTRGLSCAYRVADAGWCRSVVVGRTGLRQAQVAVDKRGDIHLAAFDSRSRQIIYATTARPPVP